MASKMDVKVLRLHKKFVLKWCMTDIMHASKNMKKCEG